MKISRLGLFLILPLLGILVASLASIPLADALYPHRNLKGDQFIDEKSAAAMVAYLFAASGFIVGIVLAFIISKLRRSWPS